MKRNTVVKISAACSPAIHCLSGRGKDGIPITQGDYSFEVKDAIASVEIANGKADTQPAEGEYPADAVTEEAATAAAESVTASLAGAAGSVASGCRQPLLLPMQKASWAVRNLLARKPWFSCSPIRK